jgi:hypothetical protein
VQAGQGDRRKILPELQTESESRQVSKPVSFTVILDVDISLERAYPAEVPNLNGNQGGTARFFLVPEKRDEFFVNCNRSVYV